MIVIVGGGIIGLSCAWFLRRAGAAVTILEAGEFAQQASWAAAGMLAPGGEFQSDSALARMALRSVALYPKFISELQENSGLGIDFRRTGGIEVSPTARQRAAAQAVFGIASQPVIHNGRDAVFYPDDALVNPRHVASALLEACRRSGAALHAHEAVLSVQGGGSQIRTSTGGLAADAVLITAGAWSSSLHPYLPRAWPVRGHLMGWTESVTDITPILRNGHTYLIRRADGTVVAGSSTEETGFSRDIDQAVIVDLRRRITELSGVPPPSEAAVWNGLRPAVAQELPVIGRLGDTNIFTAYGHYRNGILLAPETARLVVEAVSAAGCI